MMQPPHDRRSAPQGRPSQCLVDASRPHSTSLARLTVAVRGTPNLHTIRNALFRLHG